MPRITKKMEFDAFKGKFYAHRGLHNNEKGIPENSMSAFEKAIDKNYGIELDVQITKDDIAVVFHDEMLNRVCNQKGKLRDYTYDELCEFQLFNSMEKIPKLVDVLEKVDGKVPLIVEIKMYNLNKKVCVMTNNALNDYKGTYCIESFNPLALRWYKYHCPHVVRGQLSSALNREQGKKNPLLFMIEHLLTNVVARPDFISYNHLYKNRLNRILCKKIFGSLSVTWTIKSKLELEKAIKDFDIFIFEGFIPEKVKK